MGMKPFVPSPRPVPAVQSFPHTEAKGRWTNSVNLTVVDYSAHLELCTTAYIAFQRSLNKAPSLQHPLHPSLPVSVTLLVMHTWTLVPIFYFPSGIAVSSKEIPIVKQL